MFFFLHFSDHCIVFSSPDNIFVHNSEGQTVKQASLKSLQDRREDINRANQNRAVSWSNSKSNEISQPYQCGAYESRLADSGYLKHRKMLGCCMDLVLQISIKEENGTMKDCCYQVNLE